jgi:hypothetical protein
MAAADTSGAAGVVVTVNPWETRALEVALVVIGAALLAFGGFVAAFPEGFGLSSATTVSNVGPVTLAHVTTFGTTPTVVTDSSIQTTSSVTSGRSTTESWLATVLGLGALLALAGAFFRRVASLAGFGINVGMQGVVDDPATQAGLAKEIKDTHPDLHRDQAALLYAKAMQNLAAVSARAQTVVVTPQPSKLPGARLRLSPLAERVLTQATPASGPVAATSTSPTRADIAQAVADAARDLAL